jgi:TonB family protein
MRLLVCFILATVWMSAGALADEAAFRHAIGSYILAHPPVFIEDLTDRRTEVRPIVTFSIDRDGKLLDEKISSGSGSAKADQEILDWLRRLQPFPHPPADLADPLKFSEEIVFVPPAVMSDVKIKWAGDAGASADEVAFRDQVAFHLQSHPRIYSDEMKARTSMRRAVVTLSIGQGGNLLNVEMTKATGSQKVDDETLAWLKAVQPYPRMPADLKSPMKLTAEIAFGPPREGLFNDEKIKRMINNVCRGC